jgi:hypothetical protein
MVLLLHGNVMTLIARYKLDDGPEDIPTTAVDSSGHTNNHDATYYLGNNGLLLPGGATGLWSMKRDGNDGYVIGAANKSDLALTSLVSVTAWINPLTANTPIVCFGGIETDETSAENYLWSMGRVGERLRIFWEYGSGVNVDILSSVDTLPERGEWVMVGFTRSLFGAGPNLEVGVIVNGSVVETLDNSGTGYAPPTGGGNADLAINNWGRTVYAIGLGRVSDVRIWDDKIDGSTITSVYNEGVSKLDMPVDIIGTDHGGLNSGFSEV